MKHRDSPITAYYNRITEIVVCRLCVSTNVPTGLSLVFGYTCYSMTCCSCDGHPKNIYGFYFDNTKHDIVISETECKMCSYHEGNCLVKRGYTCPFNIPEYTKDFANKIDHLKKDNYAKN